MSEIKQNNAKERTGKKKGRERKKAKKREERGQCGRQALEAYTKAR